jgi:hypothetical protein
MQPINIFDVSIRTVMDTIALSPIMSIFFLLFAGFGVMVIIHHFRRPPRFDPMLHMERPPIDHRPERPLPSADAFADWATGKERQPEHRGIPWQE